MEIETEHKQDKIGNRVAGPNEELMSRCFGDDGTQKVVQLTIGVTVPVKEQETRHIHNDEDVVSIRCRRHKKRFNVPKTWLSTSEWLCPQCYKMLGNDEARADYAPAVEPEVRDAEPGKPTMFPDKDDCNGQSPEKEETPVERQIPKPERIEEESCHEVEVEGAEDVEIELDFNEVQTDCKPTPPVRRYKCSIAPKKPPAVSVIRDPSLASLLPKHCIHCHKCGQTSPCHLSWFSQSKVLCPSCFSSMTKDEVADFHRRHLPTNSDNDLINNVPTKEEQLARRRQYEAIARMEKSSSNSENMPALRPFLDADGVNMQRRYSTSFITSASKEDLLRAVQLGHISKVRARIELNRRKKASYYNDLPDVDVAVVKF